MVKLIIQIPCYNEQTTLPVTLAQLPREIEDVDIVEWLIIDDGCTDNTVEIAREYGVDHIVSHKKNLGLAMAFKTGLKACLEQHADIIVNTDADNQYDIEDLPKIIKPILEKKAEIVIGARPISDIEHFSPLKKFLQKLGSAFIRHMSQTDIPDAPSGFRAFSRDAAMKLNVFSEFTYTLETIIQAGQKNMAITWVPVKVNRQLRQSRLISSIPRYITTSIITSFRIWIIYRPLKAFFIGGGFIFLIGFLIGFRFLMYYISGQGGGHVQSLILAALLMTIGFQVFVIGVLSDLLAVNRKVLESIEYRIQKIELSKEKANRSA